MSPTTQPDATEPARGGLALRWSALSDVGRVRKDNQDSGYAGTHLLVVADGVGGAARGDIASSTAVQILRRLDVPPPANTHEAVAGAIHRAHDRIAELVEEDRELEGTSTTVTAALFDGAAITVGHVGDSRGYLLRDGTLAQLTKDHTFVQTLIDEGRITESESRTHPHRNVILRAVDGVHETEPDLFDVELAAGDRIMLCSDGCSGVLDGPRIADIMGTGSVDYATVELVRAALDAGSSDNVTVVVADVVGGDPVGVVAGPGEETSAAGLTGPMLVGAAADQPRGAGAGAPRFRGHRAGDTGELDPVEGDDLTRAVGPPGGERGPVAVAEADPETLRYAPREPRRGQWLRALVALAVLAALVLVATWWVWGWSQRQYYVAVADERVAVYRGISQDFPLITTHRVAWRSEVTMRALPAFRADQVRDGIAAKDWDDARMIVTRLTSLARVCPEPEPTDEPSGDPSGEESDRPSEQPSGQSSPQSSPQASPQASPQGSQPSQPSTRSSGRPEGQSSAQPRARAVAGVQPEGQSSGQPSGQPGDASSGGDRAGGSPTPSDLPSDLPSDPATADPPSPEPSPTPTPPDCIEGGSS